MKDNFFKGIGSYWHQFFQDRSILESFGTASAEMLSSVYMELSNLVLGLSHEGVPVYDRFKWDALTLRASDVEVVDGKYRFPLPVEFNTKGLRRSPEILSSVVSPKAILSQGYDFTIVDEFIEFNADPFSNIDIPIREVGNDLQITLWCPIADIDANRIWQNYGHFIKRWRFSTPAYKNFVRGMFHTRMFGPIVNRIESGLQLIAGLPVADGRNETVLAIIKLDTQWVVRTTVRDYYIVPNVNIRVDAGDVLTPFQSLTDTVEVIDYLVEPEWWKGNVNSLPPAIGETTDVDKAFDQYLKYNTFLVRINLTPYLRDISGLTPGNLFDINSFIEFLLEFKPSYTYVFPLFFLRLREEIPPDVYVDIHRELHSLEDRHFGYPGYNTLSSGLDLSGDETTESDGTELPGVSNVIPRNTMLGYLPELYRQIPFIPYTLSEDIHLSSGKYLSSDIELDDIVIYNKWCSPVEKTPLDLANNQTLSDGRDLQSKHYEYRHYDASMGKDLDDGITIDRFAKQGYVEEVGTSRSVNVSDEIDITTEVGILSGVKRVDDISFGPYTLYDDKNLSMYIHLGSNKSDEKFHTVRISAATESLVEDRGGIARESFGLSDGYDLSGGLTLFNKERSLRYYIVADEVVLDDGLDCSSLMRLRQVVDAGVRAQTSHLEDVETEDNLGVVSEISAANEYLTFGVLSLSDGIDLSGGMHLGENLSAERYSHIRVAQTLEKLDQEMEKALRESLGLSDDYDLSSGGIIGGWVRARSPYYLSDNIALNDGLLLESFKPFRMIEESGSYEIATGLFVDNEAPSGVYGYYTLSNDADLSQNLNLSEGINKVFSLANTPYGVSLELYKFDRLLIPGIDYTLSVNAITFNVGPVVSDYKSFYRKDASSSTVFVDHEIPVGNVDGVNSQFVISSSVVEEDSLRVYVNGKLSINGYRFVAPYINFFNAPPSGSDIRVFYRKYSRIRFVGKETLTGDVNGANTEFALTEVPDGGQVKLFEGDEWRIPGIDYELVGSVVSFATAPTSALQAYYRKAA